MHFFVALFLFILNFYFMKKIVCFSAVLMFVLTACLFLSGCKSCSAPKPGDDDFELASCVKSVANPDNTSGGIKIKRKLKWGIKWCFSDCQSGKGLCAGGDCMQDIPSVYEGTLCCYKELPKYVVFFFNDELLKDETELIKDNIFDFDEDVDCDEEMSKALGSKDIIIIQKGKYKIYRDDSQKFKNYVVLNIKK